MKRILFHLSLWVFVLALIQIHGYKACLEQERIALLEIKKFFISISDTGVDTILTSWVDDSTSDCCGWEGVRCNATTDLVTDLSLSRIRKINVSISRNYSDAFPILDFSLFPPLQELQSLDLSANFFESCEDKKDDGKASFGSLKQLKILDLSSSFLNSSVLSCLTTVTSLTTLILRGNKIKDLKGIENLKNLEVLNVKANAIGTASLSTLGMANLRNLRRLDLGTNAIIIRGSLTSQGILANLTNLEVLDLSYNHISGSIAGLGLANLTKLEVLDLSNNLINGSMARLGLADLTNLKVLNLSGNNKRSESITGLGIFANLRNLRALDVSSNNITGSLESQGICDLQSLFELNLSNNKFGGSLPKCLNNLTHLKVLDMFSNQLSGNLPSVLANLTSLEYLDLSDNNFDGIFSLNPLANHSKLEVFLLSTESNRLQVRTENFLPTFQLKVLHLRNCNLNGTIPSFLRQQFGLKYLDLSHNNLVGNFSTWLLQSNRKLEALLLRNNSMTGNLQLPNSTHGLHHFDISSNKFIGKLPRNMDIILPELVFIDMSENKFEGDIPSSIGELKELRLLDLSKNNFSGELPRPLLTGCISLELLDLSDNNLYGPLFPKYMNLTQLSILYLGNNRFSGKIGDGLQTSTQLLVLDISNNMVSGQIPHWIGNFSILYYLSMSNNLLEGNIPLGLNNLKILQILDLSENRLSGFRESSFNLSLVTHVYLQKNALVGSLPNSLFQDSILLMTLDLRDNEFFGRIPPINNGSKLRVLLLGGNDLQGHIPSELCQLQNLGILDLSRNRLNGTIPSCFANVLFWKTKGGDLYGPRLVQNMVLRFDSIGTYYNSTLELSMGGSKDRTVVDQRVEIEFVTKNRYEFYNGSTLNYMAGLDLSCNELTGEIPPEIGDLQEIRGLNLSYNLLLGLIPKNFSNLKMIESLDLSHNKLNGRIPPLLINLNYLSIFNVSYNNLSGPTPDKGQFATFNDLNYIGNSNLCGSTINKSCKSIAEVPRPPSYRGEEDESPIDMVSFIWSFVASFVTFILVLFATLLANTHWRRQWLFFIDTCSDLCYYCFWKSIHYIRDYVRS